MKKSTRTVQEYQFNEPLQPGNCYISQEHIGCIVVDPFDQNQCLLSPTLLTSMVLHHEELSQLCPLKGSITLVRKRRKINRPTWLQLHGNTGN